MGRIVVEPLGPQWKGWAQGHLAANHSTRVVSRGRLHHPVDLRGFVALQDGTPRGLLTYRIEGDEMEVVTLHSVSDGTGAGTALISAAHRVAEEQGLARLWLITTNDNTHALRFYQRRGMTIAALHVGALERSRQLKPEIPEVGNDGIPLRDEIELEWRL